MGQASTYTEITAAEICERISNGETLRAICRDDHMPSWSTVYNWIREREDFAARIARARELGFDAIAQETLEILDEAPERCDTQFGDKVDPGHVQWQKNRAEQRLKLLAKWAPSKYGERQAVELTNPDGSLRPADDTTTAARAAALLDMARQRKAEEDGSDLV